MPGNGWIWPAFFFSSLLCRLWGPSLPATKEKTQQQVLIPCPSRFLDLLLHTDLFFFLWLRLLLYFRRPTLMSGRLACGRRILPCFDFWRWPWRYWSWRWRWGVAVALMERWDWEKTGKKTTGAAAVFGLRKKGAAIGLVSCVSERRLWFGKERETVCVAFWESPAGEGELWFFQREGWPTGFERKKE